jgi:hypothetical protein
MVNIMSKFAITSLIILSILLVSCTKEAMPVTTTPAPAQQPAETQPAQDLTQQQNATNQTNHITTSNQTTTKTTVTSQSTAPPVQEMVEVDDTGFYPAGLSVKKGAKFTILFKVKSVGVYYGGLSFRSDKYNSPDIKPGDSWGTPQITADQSFTISSYWPSSGVHKADFTVNVN